MGKMRAIWSKTMEFITDLILQHIKEIGEGRVFAVCMDGV
jgi:hypothetical protein